MFFGLLRVINTEFLWKWWIIEIPQGFPHKDFNATERISSTLHPSHASHRRPRVHPCLGWRSLPTLCLSSGLLHWLPGHSGSLFLSKPSMRAKVTLLMTPVWCEVSGIITKMQWGLNECRKQVQNTASSLTYSNHITTKSNANAKRPWVIRVPQLCSLPQCSCDWLLRLSWAYIPDFRKEWVGQGKRMISPHLDPGGSFVGDRALQAPRKYPYSWVLADGLLTSSPDFESIPMTSWKML